MALASNANMESVVLSVDPNYGFSIQVDAETAKRLKEDTEFRQNCGKALITNITSANETQKGADCAKQATNEEKNEGKIWTHALIKMLIAERRNVDEKFYRPRTKKIALWTEIAKILCKKGRVNGITGDTCDKKWRALLQRYRIIKDKCDKTAGAPITWDYFEQMDAFLGVKVTSCTPKEKVIVVSNSKDDSELSSISSLSSDSSDDGVGTSVGKKVLRKRKRKRIIQDDIAPNWFTEYIERREKEREIDRKMAEQWHSELYALEKKKLKLFNRFNDLLDNVVQQQNETT